MKDIGEIARNLIIKAWHVVILIVFILKEVFVSAYLADDDEDDDLDEDTSWPN